MPQQKNKQHAFVTWAMTFTVLPLHLHSTSTLHPLHSLKPSFLPHRSSSRTPHPLLSSLRGGSLSTSPPPLTNNNNNLQSITSSSHHNPPLLHVTKRNTSLTEPVNRTKLQHHLSRLSHDLNTTHHVDIPSLTSKILTGLYPNVTTSEISILSAETAASLISHHPDYGILAARISIARNHKMTPERFSDAMMMLWHDGNDDDNENNKDSFLNAELADLIKRRGREIDAVIQHDRDWNMTYFGYKTLERSYLLKSDNGRRLIERPQYLFMRVALGIHMPTSTTTNPPTPPLSESTRLQRAYETYHHLSLGLISHASPTLFHSGTTHPQLSSCFLLPISSDSIDGIYDTLKRCAIISKSAGGIGLAVHDVRARGTAIRGTRGTSNGLVPMLRVFDATSRYVDQGGGKRPGAFAVYVEPWHADVFDVLQLKKNHGKEEQRARDLFYGLWIPDLFMRRVEEDGSWCLMCPDRCPGLREVYGKEFERLYETYEREGMFVKKIRARELWNAILESQIETGTPYMLYKDACNEKSNQKNLGTIQCSNLCTEIIQYTSPEEVAVCNLASLCLPRFINSPLGPYGSINPHTTTATFNHTALHSATKILTRNLNRIIDINHYPTPECRLSNIRHRPIGIGVSGLADAFIRLGIPFASPEAKELNEAIFETIYHASVEASSELAEEEGAYETFEGSPASRGLLQFDLWNDDATTATQQQSSFPSQRRGEPYDWPSLKKRIVTTGLRNSLLVAPMPTASTSQILGVNECFEPFVSNLYLRRVKAGEFIMANPHLLRDLADLGLWTPSMRNALMRDGGSVKNLVGVPERLKKLYETVWEMKMKDVIDMAVSRGRFIDQSQSLNLFLGEATVEKLTAMHFYGWKKGLKTGMYYLRTRPAVNAIQYTVEKNNQDDDDGQGNGDNNDNTDATICALKNQIPNADSDTVCLSCQG